MVLTLQTSKMKHGELKCLTSQLREDLSPVWQSPTHCQGSLSLPGSARLQAGCGVP